MENHYSITVKDRILKTEDVLDKRKSLQRKLEEIHECNERFNLLVQEVIINNNLEAKIVKSLEKQTNKLSNRNIKLIELIDSGIFSAVQSIHHQVDDMKVQSFKMNYKTKVPGEI